MAFLSVPNVAIRGLSACVPAVVDKNEDSLLFDKESYSTFAASTGIVSRRKANADVCTSDLCIAAAEKLIAEMAVEKSEIDCLIFVTQTPDYILPATAPIIQNRLGLSKSCLALDISLGCSGWVYALSVISSLMQSGTLRKGLLLAGDTILKFCSPKDKSTFPLFGDAGTATMLEFTPPPPAGKRDK